MLVQSVKAPAVPVYQVPWEALYVPHECSGQACKVSGLFCNFYYGKSHTNDKLERSCKAYPLAFHLDSITFTIFQAPLWCFVLQMQTPRYKQDQVTSPRFPGDGIQTQGVRPWRVPPKQLAHMLSVGWHRWEDPALTCGSPFSAAPATCSCIYWSLSHYQ